MSHLPGSEADHTDTDLVWLYGEDRSTSELVGRGQPTLLLPASTPPPAPAGRGPVMTMMIVLLLCLTAAAVAGIVLVLQSDSQTAATRARESGAAKATDEPQAESVSWVTPTQAEVGCQAPQTTDDGGNPVYYRPEQMFDGQLSTAWRCNGDGVGQVITFRFPAGTTVAEVGLVNGYAKVDPVSGAKRYGEYRRISSVAWEFANGATFRQSLTDGVKTLQKLRIPPQAGDAITLTIESSTGPGSSARGRDAVLISEVGFGQA
jgi:hypothetical protein